MSCRRHERGASALQYVGMVIVAALTRVSGLALAATILVASTAGCTAGTPSTTPALTEGSPTTAVLTAPPDAPQSFDAAGRSADALMLTIGEIPGGNWQKGAVNSDDFPMFICGVYNEPHPPVGSFVTRWEHPVGLILFQNVRPVGLTQAQQTVADLRASLKTCTSDKRIKGGQTLSYAIAPLQLSDPSVVAYRQNRSDIDQKAWTFVVYMTARDSLVAFTLISTTSDDPKEFMDTLVATVRKKA